MKYRKQDKNYITVTSAVMTGADTSNSQVKNWSDISPLYLNYGMSVWCPLPSVGPRLTRSCAGGQMKQVTALALPLSSSHLLSSMTTDNLYLKPF